MQYIIYIIFLAVSVVGLSEIIHSLCLLLLTKKSKNSKTMICHLGDKFPDLELKFLVEQRRWHGDNYADKIIAIANISDDEVLSKCISIATKENVLFINNEKILLEF